jgi:epoxyqueuosine reductase
MPVSLHQSPNLWLDEFIKNLVSQSAENDLGLAEPEPVWDEPLVGFASGKDPLWQICKDHIGDFFWTPQEAFNLTYPQAPAAPGELGVVAWILPQSAATRNENSAQDVHPSMRWAHALKYVEEFNRALRKMLSDTLNVQGVQAVAPMLSTHWDIRESEGWGRSSNWSERHAAHIAGLGTFGLCDGLITEKGKAIRAGSVVVRLPLEPTLRPYAGIHDYCLFYMKGNCGKCIPRCPMNAIGREGHDKKKCYRHLNSICKEFTKGQYGFTIDACGLCQVGVPCMDHIPVKKEGD